MKFNEASLEMKTGDIFKPNSVHTPVELKADGFFNATAHDLKTTLTQEYMSLEGQIIPAIKEFVSADVLFARIRNRTRADAWGTDDIEYAIQISEENNHLLYSDLMEKIQSWIDSYSLSSFSDSLILCLITATCFSRSTNNFNFLEVSFSALTLTANSSAFPAAIELDLSSSCSPVFFKCSFIETS